MSHLPILTRLAVINYQLYPGVPPESPWLDRTIHPGMTLVVGANGLGKTTLVSLLRNMCAGPERLRNRSGATFDAGRLRTTGVEVDTYADRVTDRAEKAYAVLEMTVGGVTFDVTRRLDHLSLSGLVVGGDVLDPTEAVFRDAIIKAADVNEYADWLLLIDHLCFITEDRLQPFWDKNIQRQLLRVLGQDPDAASALAEAESAHITADSDFRNARVQLNRHRARYQAAAAKVAGSGSINDAISKASLQREVVDGEVARLVGLAEEVRDSVQSALREAEVAEAGHQAAADELEASRLRLIEEALPTSDDIAKYLRARLALDGSCPSCGQPRVDEAVPDLAVCLLCGLPLPTNVVSPVTESLAVLEEKIAAAAVAREASTRRLDDRRRSLAEVEASVAAERSRRLELDEQIRSLRAQLPKGSNDLGHMSAALSELEDDLASLKLSMDESRGRLDSLLEANNAAVLARQDDIKAIFDDVATAFLVETCHLVPHQTLVRIGQEGERFEVQGFDLDLGSSTAIGESRRETRDSVSESQRVFVDIAFRIALIRTFAGDGDGSMVIDAPEGSLDAVFASNAANLLGEFIKGSLESRLVVASNLVDGKLLPALLRVAGITEHDDERLIDLVEVAAPTAAVTQRGPEYRSILAEALQGETGAGD